MTPDIFSTLLSATPFRPFALRLADGRECPVTHPGTVAAHPDGGIVVVVRAGGGFEVIDLAMISGIDFVGEH